MLTFIPQATLTVTELKDDRPLSCLAPTFAHLPALALLEGDDTGFGYLTADPFDQFEWNGKQARSQLTGPLVPESGLSSLTSWLKPFSINAHAGLPPFQGGAIGELDYEAGYFLDRIRGTTTRPNALLARFGLYDWVIARDNRNGRSWLICQNLDPRPGRSLHNRLELLNGSGKRTEAQSPKPAPITCELPRTEYLRMINRCIDYIAAGDAYQVCIARRLSGRLPNSPWQVYQQLSKKYPAPMAAFLKKSDGATISISPETFLRGGPDSIETRPIKGTRPRSPDIEEDKRLANALKMSDKDRAENVMIVDVLRNDLGRIAIPGTVEVPNLVDLRSWPTVHHLESRITAKPEIGTSPADILTACLPGGSVTGAPKIRAMEIIAELEPVPRRGYCGAIAAIGFDGYITSSIPIRTIYTQGSEFQFHVGGGIVSDSNPQLEYEETQDKASALLKILSASKN